MEKCRKLINVAKPSMAATAKTFHETEFDPVTLLDVEAVMHQVMKHPSRPAAAELSRNVIISVSLGRK